MPGIIYFNFASIVEINAGHMALIFCCSLEYLPFACISRIDSLGMVSAEWNLHFHLLKMILVQLALLQFHLLLIGCWLQLQID